MIKRSEDDGKENMAPDITSFNIVLNALANGREKDSGVRAESLLRKMVVVNCPPDEISFNTVINAWARSSKKGAAERATEILEHMRKRYEAGLTNVQPSWSTYTTGKNFDITIDCFFIVILSFLYFFLFTTACCCFLFSQF